MSNGEFPPFKRNSVLFRSLTALLCLLAGFGVAVAGVPPVADPPLDAGMLNPNDQYSLINAISADGSVAAGETSTAAYISRAVVWSGNNWGTKTELSSLKADGSGRSLAYAISADGKIIGGMSDIDGHTGSQGHGTIWSGSNWSTKTEILPLPGNDTSQILALSDDGKVAGGWSAYPGFSPVIWSGPGWATSTALAKLNPADSSGIEVRALSADGSVAAGESGGRAAAWSGPGWTVVTDLGSMKTDGSGSSKVFAVSSDGQVIGGYAENNAGKYYATMWSGSGWTTKTYLENLDYSGFGYSNVYASQVQGLSADGKAAVGRISSSQGRKAVLWSGDHWSTVTILKGLREDDTGSTEAYAISRDGTVAAGYSSSSAGNFHPVIWKIIWPEPDPVPEPPPPTIQTPAPEPEAPPPPKPNVPRPPWAKPVDITLTERSVRKLASDTFNMIEYQRQALIRLDKGCLAYNGEACWLTRAGTMSGGGERDTWLGFSLGYGLSEYMSVGITMEHSPGQSLPESYRRHNSNLGIGAFLDWHRLVSMTENRSEIYFRPSLFWNQNKADIRRPVYDHTEAGRGSSKIKGVGGSLESGIRYWQSDGINTN